MTGEKRERVKLLGAYAATWIIWGSTFLAIRFGVESISPFLMAGVRSVAAGGILWSWARLRGDVKPTAPQWRAAAVAGALFFLIGHGGLFWAEQRVASGPASLLVATEHFWIVLIAWLLPGGTRPSRRAAAGVALGLGGVALLTLGGGGAEGVDLLGAAAVLLCALTWGTGLLYFGGERRPASGLYAAGTPLLAGGAMLLAASALFGEPARVTAASFSPIALGSLAYLIVFGSVIAFTALTWLTETQGADRAASYAYVNPLVAVLLGWAFADEHVGARVLVAGVAIVLAVVLIIRGKQAQAASTAQASPSSGDARKTAAARRLPEGLQLICHSLGVTAPTPPIIKTAMPHASEPVRSPYRMFATVALAWLGMYVHNVADVPNLTLSSPENLLPGLVWLLLFALWWAMPGRSWPLILLLAWGILNLVGGAATVLPLPVLPFKPEQSLRHYAFHLLYALTQLPLLGIVRHETRQLRSRNDGAA